jgi:RNA polymerase sigma-70 factor (ECF subfamily)
MADRELLANDASVWPPAKRGSALRESTPSTSAARSVVNQEPDDPDARLMTLVSGGDLAAFRVLVDRYQHRLVNVLYHIVVDQAEAEDLAQDVFLKIYKAAGRYRPDAKFSTWLYRIATNTALNALKAKRRRPTVSLDEMEEQGRPTPALAGAPEPPDRVLERRRSVRAVQRALRQLPERQRMAVILHRFEGLSYQEIAEALSVSVDAVDAMLRRAKASLRDALAPYHPGRDA